MVPSLSLFVPATADPHPECDGVSSDLDRLRYILLPSIQKFIDPTLYYKIIVLTPDRDLETAQTVLAAFAHLKIEVIADSHLLPDNLKLAIPWFKQQILKLKISERIPTDLYLVLDADMVATRRIAYDDLFAHDKPRLAFDWAGHNLPWWIQSAKTMGYPGKILADHRVPGFTPQILNKFLIRKLTKKIERLYPGDPWYTTLAKLFAFGEPLRWTEYCIYWLYTANEAGLNEHYHVDPNFELAGYSLWFEHQFLAADDTHFINMFNPESQHCFSIIQSTIKQADALTVLEKINRFLK